MKRVIFLQFVSFFVFVRRKMFEAGDGGAVNLLAVCLVSTETTNMCTVQRNV